MDLIHHGLQGWVSTWVTKFGQGGHGPVRTLKLAVGVVLDPGTDRAVGLPVAKQSLDVGRPGDPRSEVSLNHVILAAKSPVPSIGN